MGATTMPRIFCGSCDAELPPEWASLVPRPKCPECGGRGVKIAIHVAEELDIAGSVTVSMRPQQQRRDWMLRWKMINAELQELAAPAMMGMSSALINLRHQRLQALYTQIFHLGDALWIDASTGLSKPQVEAAIEAEPALCLLRDLAIARSTLS